MDKLYFNPLEDYNNELNTYGFMHSCVKSIRTVHNHNLSFAVNLSQL